MRVLFVVCGPLDRIEAKTMIGISDWLKADGAFEAVDVVYSRKFQINFNSLLKLKGYDLICFHSALAHVFPFVLIAKLLRLRLVGYVWDVYPVKIDGKRFSNKIHRRILDIIENYCIKLMALKLVPTGDFAGGKVLHDAKVIKMWPRPSLNKVTNALVKWTDPVRIVFAGQVNQTRGLHEALVLLDEKFDSKYILYVASNDPVPKEVANHRNVVILGCCTQEQLVDIYDKSDFGLVSLATGFEEAAFPSKTFDYLKNNLPVIYSGPRLESFINLLVESRTGIILSDLDAVDFADLKKIKDELALNRELFYQRVCFDGADFVSILKDVKS